MKAKESNKNTGGELKSSAAESECFYCKEKGHWKRNCKKYLASKKDGSKTSGLGITINVIEINLATSNASIGYLIPDRLLIFATRCRG